MVNRLSNYSLRETEGLFNEFNYAVDKYLEVFDKDLKIGRPMAEKINAESNLVKAISNLPKDLVDHDMFLGQVKFLINGCNHSKRRFTNLVFVAIQDNWVLTDGPKYVPNNYPHINTNGTIDMNEELEFRCNDQPYFDHAVIFDLDTKLHTFYTRRKKYTREAA